MEAAKLLRKYNGSSLQWKPLSCGILVSEWVYCITWKKSRTEWKLQVALEVSVLPESGQDQRIICQAAAEVRGLANRMEAAKLLRKNVGELYLEEV